MKFMLNCRDSLRLIHAAQDRALSPSERRGLALHLWFCRRCPVVKLQVEALEGQLQRLNPYRNDEV